MDEHRLGRELAALADEYAVRVNPNQTIDLERVEFPTGWEPTRATLRFTIPDDYPVSPPTVHIPSDTRYRGRKNIVRKKSSPFDGWKKWCVRFSGWNPRRHSLVTVARQIMVSLSDPSKNRPMGR